MKNLMPPDQIILLALQEDAAFGDPTTESLVAKNQKATGLIQAREELVVCGLEVAARVFHFLDPSLSFQAEVSDGQWTEPGQIIGRITGPARPLLTGERTALNFVQRLSGIATQTSRYVRLIKGTGARLVDTRKTTPGHRSLEKYAVRCGGGRNHRFNLSDGILIKDNHLIVAGGITRAVQSVRQSISHLLKIEVEVDALDQIDECLAAKVDCILLDNMTEEQLRDAVRMIDHQCLTEASGGVNMENVRNIAQTGVDFISVGALTHTVRAVDLNMEILYEGPGHDALPCALRP
jgi:nicotinate-nucleotide pyrophosphorylase (carboxylating)